MHKPVHRFKRLVAILVTSKWQLCYQVLYERLKGHFLQPIVVPNYFPMVLEPLAISSSIYIVKGQLSPKKDFQVVIEDNIYPRCQINIWRKKKHYVNSSRWWLINGRVSNWCSPIDLSGCRVCWKLVVAWGSQSMPRAHLQPKSLFSCIPEQLTEPINLIPTTHTYHHTWTQ